MLPQYQKKSSESDPAGIETGFSALNLWGHIAMPPLITPGPENMPPGKSQESPNMRLSELSQKSFEVGFSSQKRFRWEGSPGSKATPPPPQSQSQSQSQNRDRERDRDYFQQRSARRAAAAAGGGASGAGGVMRERGHSSGNRLRGLRQTLSSPGATIGSLERATPPQRRESWEVYDEVLPRSGGSAPRTNAIIPIRRGTLSASRATDGDFAMQSVDDQENRPPARRSLAQNFETFDDDDNDDNDQGATNENENEAHRSSQPLERIPQVKAREEVWMDADLNFSSEALHFWHRDRVERNVGGWYDFKIFEDPVSA